MHIDIVLHLSCLKMVGLRSWECSSLSSHCSLLFKLRGTGYLQRKFPIFASRTFLWKIPWIFSLRQYPRILNRMFYLQDFSARKRSLIFNLQEFSVKGIWVFPSIRVSCMKDGRTSSLVGSPHTHSHSHRELGEKTKVTWFEQCCPASVQMMLPFA